MTIQTASATLTLLGLTAFGLSGCQAMVQSSEAEVYEVVATRKPSDVLMPAGPPPPMGEKVVLPLIFEGAMQWIDGEIHEDWIANALREQPLSMGDPIFADVYYKLETASDVRQPLSYSAGGEWIGTVYWVDARVGLVPAPAGSPVYILEKALPKDAALRFEQALADMGYEPGPLDGEIDNATRAAVGFYLEDQDLPYRYASPVISEALFNEVTAKASN